MSELLDKIRSNNKIIIAICFGIIAIQMILSLRSKTFGSILGVIFSVVLFYFIFQLISVLKRIKILNQYDQDILEFAKTNNFYNIQNSKNVNEPKGIKSNKEIFNFRNAINRKIFNFIWGDYQGEKVQIYNFQFLLDNPLFPNKYTMAEVEIPEIDKHLILRPEHTLQEDRFDIDIESVEFNKMYHIISKDPKFAYSVLDPLFMQELMKHREYRFEISENSLLVYAKNEISIEKIQEMLNLGITLAKILEKNL